MPSYEQRLRMYSKNLERKVEFQRQAYKFVEGGNIELIRPHAQKLAQIEGILRDFYDAFPELRPKISQLDRNS